MKQKTYPVSQSCESSELAYLNRAVKDFCYRIYSKMNGLTVIGTPPYEKRYNVCWHRIDDSSVHDAIISDLYYRGRSLNACPWHYFQFRNLILDGANLNSWTPNPYQFTLNSPKPEAYTSWYIRYKLRHEKSTKYRKLEHHKPKEIDEKLQAKTDWREFKNFNKDKCRNRHWRNRRSARWLKRQLNKEERQAVREALDHGDYDNIRTTREPFDWWRFD